MRKYSEFRREMWRRKYRHHVEQIARAIYYGAIIVIVTALFWAFVVAYTLTFAD